VGLPLGACTLRYGDPIPSQTAARDVGWLDKAAYPFQSHFFPAAAGALHYVDEGDPQAPPVVLVHGTPTWSFLYRNAIADLRSDFRVVAADHLGFGLSDKPDDPSVYETTQHVGRLVALWDELDLKDITLVIHDLGGPVALLAVLERPERVSKIVVLNTFMWPVADTPDVERIDGLLNSSIGEFLYIDRNISPEMLLPSAFSDEFELSDGLKQQYTHPFNDEKSRRGLLEIGRSLTRAEPLHKKLWSQRALLAPKIKALVFGLDDAFFGPEVFLRWRETFPHARAVGLKGVGHFPQEEAAAMVNQVIRDVRGGLHEPAERPAPEAVNKAEPGTEAAQGGPALQ